MAGGAQLMSQVIVHITTICLALGLPGKKSPSSQVRSLTCQGLIFHHLVQGSNVWWVWGKGLS